MRDKFEKGTSWIQLDGTSTPETIRDAVVSLVYHICGADSAKRLLPMEEVSEVVVAAVRCMESVPAAEADKIIVVIDEVYDKKRDLLVELLRVVPSSTSAIFTTRADSVASMPGWAAHAAEAARAAPCPAPARLSGCPARTGRGRRREWSRRRPQQRQRLPPPPSHRLHR